MDAVRRVHLSYQQIIAMIYVVAMFMTIMDATIVYVALPAIARSFDVSPAATDGVVVGYLVSLAVWIPASGWVGDRFGTKRTFMVADRALHVSRRRSAASRSRSSSWCCSASCRARAAACSPPSGMAMLYRAYPPAQRARSRASSSSRP